ncbi:MAG: hypothetical protein CK528_14830 [Alcaligenaceae bacterium]|nr:MAG: hypothetical protein CK528_14830 [Alcaligenaceae bacterium]
MSALNSLTQTDRLEAKTHELEIKLTAQIADLKTRMEANIDGCKAESSDLRVDVAVLKSSHKFVLWILGGFAIMALSFVFGLSVLTLLRSLR